MTPDGKTGAPSPRPISCEHCNAACCRLEVICLSDGEIPDHLTQVDAWGNWVMARLDDGWCAALDRSTLRCRIYAQRPLGCRELEMGGTECREARAAGSW